MAVSDVPLHKKATQHTILRFPNIRSNYKELLSNASGLPFFNFFSIYFAGHGGCNCSEHVLISECDNNSCFAEALCPLDRDTIDAKGCCVPDREPNALFTEISQVKENKITLFIDFCYARSPPGPRLGNTRRTSNYSFQYVTRSGR